jgi:hypothetical protein
MRLAALAHGQLTDATASAADQAAPCLRARTIAVKQRRGILFVHELLVTWSRFGGRGYEGEL